MSKSLKKLIDINRLREFKNKLVGTDSAYVQTGAVDQTVAGTKTFSKPIVGSVTGSSGSCTGNAASANIATKADSATKAANADHATSADSATRATSADRASAANCVQSQTSDYHEIRFDWDSQVPGYVGLRVDATDMGGIVTTNIASSAYVQTAAVDQTIAGTKTFSKPIVGSVTGSSGSCTGNSATATKATQDSDGNKITTTYSKNGHTHDDRYYTENEVNNLLNGKANTSGTYSNLTVGNAGSATNATYANWLRTSSHSDHLFHTEWDGSYFWTYVTTGSGEYRAVRVARSDSSGNADTAAKLATARTIALSGAATGTATAFDGSGNITIPVTALSPSAIRAQWYAAYPDGPEAHNAMWGGRDITAAFNNGTVSANIANGTFKDIFPGDYITKQVIIRRAFADDDVTVIFEGGTYTVNWVIADCDYWINKGDAAMTAHHVVIVPQVPIFTARMHPDNTTAGGCAGSIMYRKIIPACARGIEHAFGSDHILVFRDAITNSGDISHVSSGASFWAGASDSWGWYDAQCNLMSEAMVYGGPHCASSAFDNIVATRQMSAFRLSEKLINYNRLWWWLRDVVSSAAFARVGGTGDVGASDASAVVGVRPFALLK